MKTAIKHFLSILVFGLINITVNGQICVQFEDTAHIFMSPTDDNKIIYSESGVDFRFIKGDAWTGGPYQIYVDSLNAWSGPNGNDNFLGHKMLFSFAETHILFNNAPFASKKITIDVNSYGGSKVAWLPDTVWAQGPYTVSVDTVSLLNGGIITITGDIDSLKIGAPDHNDIAIDNICVSAYVPNSSCYDFDTLVVPQTFNPTNSPAGTTFFQANGVDFIIDYQDHTGLGIDSSINFVDAITSGFSGDNPNFIGNVIGIGEALLTMDFNNLSYLNKEVSFDMNYAGGNLSVNGGPVVTQDISTYTGSLAPGVYHQWVPNSLGGGRLILTGPINTVQLGAFEMAIDNLCTQPIQGNLCIDLDGVSGNPQFNPTNSPAGSVFYSDQGVDFSIKYENHTGTGIDYSVNIIDAQVSNWINYHTDFSGNVMSIGEAKVVMDLTNFGQVSKQVGFDVTWKEIKLKVNNGNIITQDLSTFSRTTV
jgi:hypothetical protein